MVFEQVYRIVKPMAVAIQHLFSTPITIKYPYEKIVNTTDENYRYDPKAGIAYPGFKGRHVLYLDKCTGCSLCDIACQNIAEAIIMVYGFNITLQLSKRFVDDFKKGEAKAVEFIEKLTKNLFAYTHNRLHNSHPIHPVSWSDFRSVKQVGEVLEWKLNIEPVYAYRSEAIAENYFGEFLKWAVGKGWSDEVVEVQGADKENEYHRLAKDGYEIKLAITKIDEKLAHNKKSYFPAVDYSRCVFCGFCVDACPFYALEMSPDYELSAMDRKSLLYTPKMLAKPGAAAAPAETGWLDRLVMVLRGW